MSGHQEEHAGPTQKKVQIEVDGVIFTRSQAKNAQSYDPSVFLPFNVLSNEVIEHLFAFLDRKSLKMSLLVDKRWNKIISSSLKVMKKLPITIRLTRGGENQKLKKFERRYRVFQFKNVDKKLPKYIEDALAKIGSEVETVTFSDCSYKYKILEVLNCFPKVANVVIEAEELDHSAKTKVQIDANVIKNLKTLKINRIASVIESFVGADKLTELHLKPVWNDWRHLIALLSTQTRLKTLKIYNMNNIPINIELMPMQCQVQELSIGHIPIVSDKFLQFVKSFSSSVATLSIQGTSIQLLLPMIRDSFKVLKHLTLSLRVLPSPDFFEQQLTKFASLEFLHIHATKFRNSAELVGFFSLFPSIKQLQISSVEFDASITPGDIKNVTQGLLGVEYLVVHETVGILKHAAFKNVSDIRLQSFDAAEKINWKEIVDNNPKMNSFVIGIKFNREQLDLKALKQCSFKKFRLRLSN